MSSNNTSTIDGHQAFEALHHRAIGLATESSLQAVDRHIESLSTRQIDAILNFVNSKFSGDPLTQGRTSHPINSSGRGASDFRYLTEDKCPWPLTPILLAALFGTACHAQHFLRVLALAGKEESPIPWRRLWRSLFTIFKRQVHDDWTPALAREAIKACQKEQGLASTDTDEDQSSPANGEDVRTSIEVGDSDNDTHPKNDTDSDNDRRPLRFPAQSNASRLEDTDPAASALGDTAAPDEGQSLTPIPEPDEVDDSQQTAPEEDDFVLLPDQFDIPTHQNVSFSQSDSPNKTQTASTIVKDSADSHRGQRSTSLPAYSKAGVSQGTADASAGNSKVLQQAAFPRPNALNTERRRSSPAPIPFRIKDAGIGLSDLSDIFRYSAPNPPDTDGTEVDMAGSGEDFEADRSFGKRKKQKIGINHSSCTWETLGNVPEDHRRLILEFFSIFHTSIVLIHPSADAQINQGQTKESLNGALKVFSFPADGPGSSKYAHYNTTTGETTVYVSTANAQETRQLQQEFSKLLECRFAVKVSQEEASSALRQGGAIPDEHKHVFMLFDAIHAMHDREVSTRKALLIRRWLSALITPEPRRPLFNVIPLDLPTENDVSTVGSIDAAIVTLEKIKCSAATIDSTMDSLAGVRRLVHAAWPEDADLASPSPSPSFAQATAFANTTLDEVTADFAKFSTRSMSIQNLLGRDEAECRKSLLKAMDQRIACLEKVSSWSDSQSEHFKTVVGRTSFKVLGEDEWRYRD